MRISSIYTTTKVLVKGHRISSIILINVVGAFVKTKGMTIHSKRPSFYFKAVFHTFVLRTKYQYSIEKPHKKYSTP
jgi:hypothetical protein